jgi:hypothetical protein
VIQFWIRPAWRRSNLSLGLDCRGTRWHNSSGTLFTAFHGLGYVVKRSLAWRNRGQQRPLQRWPLGHVAGQMNMADEPVPETPFTSPLIFYPSIVYPPRAQHESYWRTRITARDRRRQGSLHLRSYPVYCSFLNTLPKLPDRPSLRHCYSLFQAATYQVDFSKVALLHIVFNFVIVTMVLTSLDQPQFSSKVDQMSLTVQLQITP